MIDAASGTFSGWIPTDIVPHDVIAMADGYVDQRPGPVDLTVY